jgi:hypothetical protein
MAGPTKQAGERILAIDSGARLVVASGYSADTVMASYRDYGFCGRLAKPWSLKELKALLANVEPRLPVP